MAKYRHRTFEMFEFRDEAISALASKSTRGDVDSVDPGLWTFQQFTTSRSEGVTHITFKQPKCSEEEASSRIRVELSLIADSLTNNSPVVMDFQGLSEFSADSIDALAMFNRRLQSKGSRLALCNLEPEVHAAFFPDRRSR